jgi:hypothetical protein
MIITQEVRAKILLHLPKDYQKQGNRATGYSKAMIYKVLHEEQPNEAIAEWLMKAAASEKKKREKAHKNLARLAEQL